MIKEVVCRAAIEQETQPDGPSVPVVDAYDGCQLRCPYCFQWQDPSWNQDILVKTNLPEVLAEQLDGWDTADPIYVGSRGDPYMALEQRYRLTRRTLQVLRGKGVPCFLSTKSNEQPLFDDLRLFVDYGEHLTICMGQSNLAHFRKTTEPSALPNILMANELLRLGVRTQVFITPVLPGITDVKAMIHALPPNAPVYLDKLRLPSGSAAEQRFFGYLLSYHPHLESRYRELARDGKDPYYEELRALCDDDPRVRYVFGEH